VGSGKTTAAEAVGDLLGGRGVPHAVVDLDWLRRSWPAPAGDPFNLVVELANLAAVAATYRHAGAHRLVLAGVLEDAAARERYRQAVGVRLHVARLVVDLPVVHQRLRARHAGRTAELDWHLQRSGELHDVLQAAGAEDFTLRADTLSPQQTAAALVAAADW
jgi:hypothetical protein